MNQEQNNFNIQGNNGMPNNQPLNNQSFNQGMGFNQQPINPQPQPIPQPMNTFESGNASNQSFQNNQNSQQINNTYQQQTQYTQPQQPIKPKKNKLIKLLAIIGGIVVGFIVLLIVIYSIISASSEKLVCKSDEGKITIMYNDKTIIGYIANEMSYDLDGQKKYAEQIGVDAYIKEFTNWFKNNTSGTCAIDGKEVPTHNTENKNEDIQEGKRVGSDEFGYITIPENWTTFIDVDGNSTLQYSYANIYIATLYAVPTTQIDSYTYASNIMNKLKNDGVQNVQGATVNVGKYTAYQVYGYYSNENVWLVCYFFEAEDGKTHYISVEGPDRNSEYFSIPNSFSLNQ